MKKIVVFGAGNIGRSLVGQLFSSAGYEVVFIEVVDWLVEALNEKKRYRIEVKDVHEETMWVENVRAVHGKNENKVIDEVATSDIVATAVGPNNLRYIYAPLAKGLVKRIKRTGKPLDIIICENVRGASELFRKGLSKHLPDDFPLDSKVGLVETSIGKMVPLMTEKQKRKDPLLLYAEAYNKIVLDKKAFRGELPKVEGLEFKDNMTAYVDRKLFIHNLGHAATAYLGYLTDPGLKYVWEAIGKSNVREAVKKAMWESGRALIREYPEEFNHNNVKEYIDDLIRRFSNRALGDTIYRVGRDIPRKLSRNDRLIGALLLDRKHSIPANCTALAAAAAVLFRGKDEHGQLYLKDAVFVKQVYPRGIDYVLKEVCGLRSENDKPIAEKIKRIYKTIINDPKNWFSAVGCISTYSPEQQ